MKINVNCCLVAMVCMAVIGPKSVYGTPTTALADLSVSEVMVTSISGGKIEYCYRVVNNGQASANLEGVVVRGMLSADEHADAADTPAGSHTLSGKVDAGQSIFCCCAGLVAVNPPQTPYLIITVDADNAVKESDESNNSKSVDVTSVFTDKQDPAPSPPTILERTYAQTDIIVKARPSQTIVFEPPAPPTFVFLPQVVTSPRVINMQPPTGRQVIVIGNNAQALQIPEGLLEYKPPCLCVPSGAPLPPQTPTPTD